MKKNLVKDLKEQRSVLGRSGLLILVNGFRDVENDAIEMFKYDIGMEKL